MTGGWSTGRNKKYPFYTCRQKGCERNGKSIRRDVIDEQFEKLLQNMQPAPETLRVAEVMFKALWENQADVQQESRNALESDIAELNKQKDTLLDKLLDSSNSTVMAACEQRIEKIERDILAIQQKMQKKLKPLRTFDETFRTAMLFLSNPYKLWGSGTYTHKRAVLRLCFLEHLVFDKNKGFRTASKAQPFRVLEGFFGGNYGMVVDSNSRF